MFDNSETTTSRDWRHIERYAYVERPYEDVWCWVAGHLSSFGTPLPGGGHSVDLRIRPGGMEISRPVRLHVGGVVAGEDGARAALGWVDAARPHLFPELEAVLEIAPVPNDERSFTQLGVLARYLPPFRTLGVIGDRLVGAEMTDAALAIFLDDLTAAVEKHTPAPSRQAEEDRDVDDPDDDAGAIQRVLLMVEGLAVRRGGAVGACAALAAVPGVVNVSLDPWTGLVAVDHHPTQCDLNQLIGALS